MLYVPLELDINVKSCCLGWCITSLCNLIHGCMEISWGLGELDVRGGSLIYWCFTSVVVFHPNVLTFTLTVLILNFACNASVKRQVTINLD